MEKRQYKNDCNQSHESTNVLGTSCRVQDSSSWFEKLDTVSRSVCITAVEWLSRVLPPHGLLPARLLCPWEFPGKNTGVGCHALLQRIFPTQGLNPRLLHWQADSLLMTTGRLFFLHRGLYLRNGVILLGCPLFLQWKSGVGKRGVEWRRRDSPSTATVSAPWADFTFTEPILAGDSLAGSPRWGQLFFPYWWLTAPTEHSSQSLATRHHFPNISWFSRFLWKTLLSSCFNLCVT